MGLLLLAVACSSGAVGSGGGDDGEAGAGGEPRAGAGAGASSGAVAGKGSSGGADASGGLGAEGGGEPALAGAGGGNTQPSAGAGGDPSSSAEAGAGGRAHAGDGGGPAPDPDPLGNAGAGGETTDPSPDPCEGKTPWDPQASWTEYSQNEQRAFGGVLWRCQNPQFCGTYPGSPSAPGWLKVEDCAGGPTGEVAPCQCEEGACCDGCYFRPRSYFCGETSRYQRCTESGSLEHDYWNLFCNGDTGGDCDRWAVHTKYAGGPCGAGASCVETSNDAAACVVD